MDLRFNTAENQFKFSLQHILHQKNAFEEHLKGDCNVLEVFLLIHSRVS